METFGGHCWAKTTGEGLPGISVEDHCTNVGSVAQALIDALPARVRAILPPGSATLAALHDIGKITLGFQAKCPAWLNAAPITPEDRLTAAYSVSDHALVSQIHIQPLLKATGAQIWAVAVGAHHGRPKGRSPNLNGKPEALRAQAEDARREVLSRLISLFGQLPTQPPDEQRFGASLSDLWLLSGLITVADWVGSNEEFFSPAAGVEPAESRRLAASALARIGWPGGSLRQTTFQEAFSFPPNTVQAAVLEAAATPGLIIVEAPMGCGKTEAALHAAQQLIVSGQNRGLYFALPTQVTSNRIHKRIARFLGSTLQDPATLRLAHSHAWLEDDYDFRFEPSHTPARDQEDDTPHADAREARSWFASAKQALIAPYGVGTIDQALQSVVAVKHFFVRRFALAGKVVVLDEIHSYDIYTGTLVAALVRELMHLGCSVIILSATLTARRRQELLEAAGSQELAAPTSYPLITVGAAGSPIRHLCPAWSKSRAITLRVGPISEEETIETLLSRAEAGQHVLWIRNTVVEAQQTFRAILATMREGSAEVGLLHSRFPFQHRQDLEQYWLTRLGPSRPEDSSGSILVATQVVEQSVDIDLDFIVSDLAPTDMLLQRMGRLWRHDRTGRKASQPEFWIRLPNLPANGTATALKQAIGRSARVYAPYVLLRSAAVFAGRTSISLPDDIRPLLEATYAEPTATNPEPVAWQELHTSLQKEKQELTSHAQAAMLLLGRPMVPVDEQSDQALTRRKGPPTVPVLILRHLTPSNIAAHCQVTTLEGSTATISDYHWSIASAKFLHPWLVRVPRWMVPQEAPRPLWLALHVAPEAAYACLTDDGRLLFGDVPSAAAYLPRLGVFSDQPNKSPQPEIQPWSENDDEFDN